MWRQPDKHGKNYRGAGRRVVTADGSKIACPSCVGRAFLVVPSDSFAPCTSCGKAACICLVCAHAKYITERAAVSEEAVAVLRGRVRPVEIRLKSDAARGATGESVEHRVAVARDEGYVDGIEMAIATLRTGRF